MKYGETAMLFINALQASEQIKQSKLFIPESVLRFLMENTKEEEKGLFQVSPRQNGLYEISLKQTP